MVYFIDDTNSTIQYSTGSGSVPWNHKSAGIANNSADVTKCYDQTYSVNQNLCSQSDSCHFQLSFTGSGITLFVIQSYNPLNTTMTLDGNKTANANIVNLPGYSDLAYNVTLYNVQSLPVADHTLDVALDTYTFSNGTSMGSLIRFDYAAVNQTAPSTTSSGTGTATPTPTSPSSHSHSVIGPAVGGAVGGIAVIAAIIFALLFYRRRNSAPHVTEVDPDPRPMVFEARRSTFDAASTLYNPQVPPTPQPFTYASASRSSFPASDSNDWRSGSFQLSQSSGPTHTSSTPLVPRDGAPYLSNASSSVAMSPFTIPSSEIGTRPNTSSHTAAAPTRPSKRSEARSVGSSSAPISTTSLPLTHPVGGSSGELTEEQIIFVNNLRGLNVPAAEIARLMEVMRREREGNSGASNVPQGDVTSNADAPPPRYDFKSPT